MPKLTPYHGKGYFIKHYRVPLNLYTFIYNQVIKIIPEDTPDVKILRGHFQKFLAHLFVSMFLRSKDLSNNPGKKLYIPIGARLLDKELDRGFILKNEKSLRTLIEIKPHNKFKGESREYRISPEIYEQILIIFKKCLIWEHKGKPIKQVDIFTGKPDRRKRKSKRHILINGVPYYNIPDLINKSINILEKNPCPITLTAAHEYFLKLSKKFRYEEKKFRKATEGLDRKTTRYKRALKIFQVHQGKYENDLGCLYAIRLNASKTKSLSKNTETMYMNPSTYRIQKSGRLTEDPRGFQSASRYLKHLLIKYTGVYNYDLKNSQARILLQEMRRYDIECDWLEKYINKPHSKRIMAKRAKMDVETWKTCFYAIVMGAEATNEFGAVYKEIDKSTGFKKKATRKKYRAFLKVAEPLIEATNKWRDRLFNCPVKEHYRRTRAKDVNNKSIPVRKWKNACNLAFPDYFITDETNTDTTLVSSELKSTKKLKECKRKLAAFILQGQEASLMHHLTILCDKNHIKVHKNEHDGLITNRKIPSKITRKAGKLSKTSNPELVVKPICSKSEITKRKDYLSSRSSKKK